MGIPVLDIGMELSVRPLLKGILEATLIIDIDIMGMISIQTEVAHIQNVVKSVR